MTRTQQRGVNLGNWLVLEKWMAPGLFEGTTAEDETELCRQLDETVRRERFRLHRDEFVTERDFVYLAARGVDLVRLPVPYFVFGGHDPYVGCIDYVDLAFGWARKHGIAVLLDLHTVPDSQNGYDNGGMCGVCKWHLDPVKVELALDVLERLAARYGSHPSLWGIEVVNEPISRAMWELVDVPRRFTPADPAYAAGSEPVPSDFLRDYYREAYTRIRALAPETTVVFHDGFRIDEWAGFLDRPEFTNVVVDTHLYLMEYALHHGLGELDDYVGYVRDVFAPTVREVSQHVPVMVGEWSLDTTSPAPHALPPDERQRYFRRMADVQLDAWRPAVAWTYWSYKMTIDTPASDVWDFGKALDLGFLPDEALR
jgi:glucan 1,3-beta-glucosidase